MERIEWDHKYDIGVDAIDNQHRFFLSLINRIRTHLNNVDDKSHRAQLLGEIQKYAEFHFLSEPNIAREMGIFNVDEHLERHRELLIELERHIHKLKKNEYNDEQFFTFIIEWFFGHTYLEDRELFRKK